MSESHVPADARPLPSALDRAKLEAGGNRGLSRLLRENGHVITSQAISQWEKVPATRVLAVEEATGVPKYELRPDIYPPPRGRSPKK